MPLPPNRKSLVQELLGLKKFVFCTIITPSTEILLDPIYPAIEGMAQGHSPSRKQTTFTGSSNIPVGELY
jgi:hypothetical protein